MVFRFCALPAGAAHVNVRISCAPLPTQTFASCGVVTMAPAEWAVFANILRTNQCGYDEQPDGTIEVEWSEG